MTPEELIRHTEHIESLKSGLEILEEEKADILRSLIEFASSRLVYIADGSNVDLWGFGDVPAIFLSPDEDSMWTYLHLLPNVLGAELEDLVELYDQWADDEKYKQYVGEVVYNHVRAEVVESAFIFWAFSTVSVWKEEFLKNLNDLLVITYQKTGAGDDVMVLPTYRMEDGTTYTDKDNPIKLSEFVEQQGLPDQDEAMRKAFRGPMGAIEDV